MVPQCSPTNLIDLIPWLVMFAVTSWSSLFVCPEKVFTDLFSVTSHAVIV